MPEEIYNSLNIKPDKVLKSREVYNNIKDVINIKINREIFDKINIDPGGVILTSKEMIVILFRDISHLNQLILKTRLQGHLIVFNSILEVFKKDK